MLQHRSDVRILAIEGAEHRTVILALASGQDHVAEALAVGSGQAAMRGEPGKRVVIEHYRPLVGVVAGRIVVTPNVLEVAGAVSGRYVKEVRVRALQGTGL